MPTEMVLRKRASTRAGEIGLFCDVEVWQEEFSAIKNDTDVKAVVSQPRSLKQHKFAWALATKVAEACDWLTDKDDAMEYMLIESKHRRLIYDPVRQISYARALPTNWGAMDGVAFTKLLRRMTYIVGTHIVPGIDNEELRAEIDRMLNPDLIPTDMGPEPPPIDTIPDGPGTGHNSRPAGVEPIQPERTAGAPPRASASYADVKAPGAREATQRPSNGLGEDAAGRPVRTLHSSGEPDWSKEMPGDAHTYWHYAKFQINRKQSLELAMGWIFGDEQSALRNRLGLQIGARKQLEAYAAERFGP